MIESIKYNKDVLEIRWDVLDEEVEEALKRFTKAKQK